MKFRGLTFNVGSFIDLAKPLLMRLSWKERASKRARGLAWVPVGFFLLLMLASPPLLATQRWKLIGPDGGGRFFGVFAIDPSDGDIVYASNWSGLFKSVDGGVSWHLQNRGLGNLRVSALAIDPDHPSTVYAGTARGVFKTLDGGIRWLPSSCGIEDRLVDSLSINPANPEILYATTSLTTGVWKSEDSGENWRLVENGFEGTFAYSVAVAPSQPEVLYAGTRKGVFRSVDSGESWMAANAGITQSDIFVMVVDPTNSDIVYASDPARGKVIRSTNGGQSWEDRANGIDDDGEFFLAINPQNPQQLFAGGFFVYQTTDGGASWSTNKSLFSEFSLGIYTIAVDPTDGQTVFAGSAIGGPGVLKSLDAGQTWEPSSAGLTYHLATDILIDPENPDRVLLAVDDTNEFYLSNDGGDHWEASADGIVGRAGSPVGILDLELDPSNSTIIYAGVFENGIFRSDDGGQNWGSLSDDILRLEGVFKVAVNPTNSSNLFAFTNLNMFRSDDSGATWSETGSGLSTFVNDLIIEPETPSRMWAASAAGLFRSTDSGATFTKVDLGSAFRVFVLRREGGTLYLATNKGLLRSLNGASFETLESTTEYDIRSFEIDPSDSGHFFIGTNDGQVLESRDSGASFFQAGESFPEGFTVTALAVDPRDSTRVFAGTRRGVYRREAGTAWLFSRGRLAQEGPQFDGVAVSNYSAVSAKVNLDLLQESVDPLGLSISQTDERHYRQGATTALLELAPRRQVARVRTDLFENADIGPAWVALRSDTSEVASFFQFGGSDLSRLDGGVPILEPSKEFVFHRIFEGSQVFRGQPATTRLSILNPGNAPVTIALMYRGANLNVTSSAEVSVEMVLPAASFLSASAEEIFGFDLPEGHAVGRVVSGDGVVAFETVELEGKQTILGLNASIGESPARLFSAQLASQGDLFTNVNLINTSDAERVVTLNAIGPSGDPVRTPKEVTLQSGQQISGDARELFADLTTNGGGDDLLASLEVVADGSGVVGDVIFGDGGSFEYAAALSLQGFPFREAIFSQVANIPGFFTGLAFFHPSGNSGGCSGEPAVVQIDVFNAEGNLVGSGQIEMGPGQRASRLVPEIAPASDGQAGGYIRMTSDHLIIAQMLFGVIQNGRITLFSAVPPTVIRE